MPVSPQLRSYAEPKAPRVHPGRVQVFQMRESAQPVLLVAGEVDISNSAELRDRLVEVLQGVPGPAVVDLSQLGFCDLSGLDALRLAARVAADAGSVLTFRGMSAQLQWLDSTFPVAVPSLRRTR